MLLRKKQASMQQIPERSHMHLHTKTKKSARRDISPMMIMCTYTHLPVLRMILVGTFEVVACIGGLHGA